MALVNGGFLHYTDMEKFLKNLVLRNRRSDFEIISQKSGFDISRRPVSFWSLRSDKQMDMKLFSFLKKKK